MPGVSGQAHADWRPTGNPWIIALAATLAAFMETLDTTIVNVSLPHIAGSLSASNDDATWSLTSYLVANGIVIPISGSLARILGRKRYFLICIAGFTVCSFLCGISANLSQLVIFRLAQGFFGGGLQPTQQSILLDTFEPAQRGRAFSIVAVATIFAPIIGPTFGGWITDTYSWRWVFLLNIPIGILALFANAALVEDPPWGLRERLSWRNLDYTGIALITLGFGALQIVLDRGEDDDWLGSPFIVAMVVLAILGTIGAVTWLLYAKQPVVNLRVFGDRNFAVGSVVVLLVFSSLYATAVLLPQLAQVQFGYTATLAGLILSPGGLLVIPMIPLVGRLLMPNVQTRFIVAIGILSLALALAYATIVNPNLSFLELASLRMAQTFGLAFIFAPNSVLSYSTMPRRLNTDATSIYVMTRNIAGSMGISVSTAMVTQRAQIHRAYLSQRLSPLDSAYASLLARIETTLRAQHMAPGDIAAAAAGLINRTLNQQAAFLAYKDVFAYTSIFAFCVIPVVFLFKNNRKAKVAAPALEH